MELKDVLDERIIDLNMEAKNKDEAIRHLAAKLKDANYIGDVDEFVKDIYLRESKVLLVLETLLRFHMEKVIL